MNERPHVGLRIRTLGPFRVSRHGVPIPEIDWPRRKTKELLKVLLTAPGDVFTVDQLIEVLLPDADAGRAAPNVRARVSELRRVLEPGLRRGSDSRFVRRVGEGYAFVTGPDAWLDALAFEAGVAAGHRHADAGRWAEAAEALDAATMLYRGEFLSEDRYAEWTESTRAYLRRRYAEAMGRLASCYARLDRSRDAVSCCHKVLAVDPCDEGVARQLMGLLHDAGHQAHAVRVHRRLAESLHSELDVEPSDETQRLFRQISHREPLPGARLDPCRVAVIPFVSVGSDPESEILADGVTEELIYALSRVSGLEVVAQTTALKYKGSGKSVAEIGQELRVGTVLEGSVQRVRNRARILVQLIDVAREAHLWAEQYDRTVDDVLQTQADIARHTAQALQVRLLPAEEQTLGEERLLNPRAQAAYIQGRRLLGRQTPEAYQEAVARFEEVLTTAPRHARSLMGLAEAHLARVDFGSASESHESAMQCADAVLAADPACAEALAIRGRVLWLRDRDVEQAERALVHAIDINPNCSVAHVWYADLLGITGRLDAACRQSEIALSLDPLSAPLVLSHAESLHASGQLAKAIDRYRRAIEIDPDMADAWWGLWYSLAAAWDWDRAEAITRQTVEEHPDHPFAYVNLATCVMCRGRLREGIEEIRKALALAVAPKRTSILFHAGACHYFAREYETAIEYLHEVLERNPGWSHSHNMIAKCSIQLERYEEALAELEAAERGFGGAVPFWQTHVHKDRGVIYARLGQPERAEQELQSLMKKPGRQNYRIAVSGIHAALGRIDDAMDWMEAAATAREPHIAALRKAPELDAVRSHPRFQALLRRVGLAD